MRYQYNEQPAKVLILGESARDEKFARILDEALCSVMKKMPMILREDAESVAAMGAAELAKRAPWDPYKV